MQDQKTSSMAPIALSDGGHDLSRMEGYVPKRMSDSNQHCDTLCPPWSRSLEPLFSPSSPSGAMQANKTTLPQSVAHGGPHMHRVHSREGATPVGAAGLACPGLLMDGMSAMQCKINFAAEISCRNMRKQAIREISADTNQNFFSQISASAPLPLACSCL